MPFARDCDDLPPSPAAITLLLLSVSSTSSTYCNAVTAFKRALKNEAFLLAARVSSFGCSRRKGGEYRYSYWVILDS